MFDAIGCILKHPLFYTLVNKKPVPVYDFSELIPCFDSSNFRVESTHYKGFWISTVFLGIDHGFGRSNHPILFETMIFDHGQPCGLFRCCTWDEAVEQHKNTLYSLAVKLDIDFTLMVNDMTAKSETPSTTDKDASTTENFVSDLLLSISLKSQQ